MRLTADPLIDGIDMGFTQLLFYLFGAITLWSAVMLITRRNPVHSVLFLVLAFVSSAGLWLLIEAEFLGIVLVLVYVGAVMVLFLFVVMMLNVDSAKLRAGFIRYLPVGVLIALIMAVEIFLVVGPRHFGIEAFPPPPPAPAGADNTHQLGLLLYSVYLYPVEIAAVLLLVAIVAAIRLSLRHRSDRRQINPAEQVRVRKGPDRIRLVQMDERGLGTGYSSPGGENAESRREVP